MEAMAQELMLDKYVGKKGSPEREEYEVEVCKALNDYYKGKTIMVERERQGLT